MCNILDIIEKKLAYSLSSERIFLFSGGLRVKFQRQKFLIIGSILRDEYLPSKHYETECELNVNVDPSHIKKAINIFLHLCLSPTCPFSRFEFTLPKPFLKKPRLTILLRQHEIEICNLAKIYGCLEDISDRFKRKRVASFDAIYPDTVFNDYISGRACRVKSESEHKKSLRNFPSEEDDYSFQHLLNIKDGTLNFLKCLFDSKSPFSSVVYNRINGNYLPNFSGKNLLPILKKKNRRQLVNSPAAKTQQVRQKKHDHFPLIYNGERG